MAVKKINIPNARLTEGQWYTFRILKVVSLGEDEGWFVMQDPNGYKILLPKGFYEDYGFAPGQSVSCRVDKINCNGRMFLEPGHPHYKEGEVYDLSWKAKAAVKTSLTRRNGSSWSGMSSGTPGR